MCVGRRFAEMHMYVLISTILRHFKLDYNVDKRMDSIYYTLLFEYCVINVARQLDNIHYDSGVYQSTPENSYGLHNDQVITIFIIDLQ